MAAPWTRCPCRVHSLHSCAQQPCEMSWREGEVVVQGLQNGADAVLLGRTGGGAGRVGESEGEGRGSGSPWGSLRVLFIWLLGEDTLDPRTS